MSEPGLQASEKELLRRIAEITHYMWDPIGVCGHPESFDEYDGYVLPSFSKVRTGDINQVITYMRWVETERMGLSFGAEAAHSAAEAMMAWQQYIVDRDSRQ